MRMTKKEMKEKLRRIPKQLEEVIDSTSNLKIKISLIAIKTQIEEILRGS